jgi:hypothetical protein
VARFRDIVIDCDDAAALARFWAAALDGDQVRAYDDDEIARLASAGYTPATDPAVAVDGPGPTIFFQQVPGERPARNRLHFDLVGEDRATEIARLRALGASTREERRDHTVMLDPEGNTFCVLDPERG